MIMMSICVTLNTNTEFLMTIDQVDLVDSRAWLTSELWSSEFIIMVKYSGPTGFYTEIGSDKHIMMTWNLVGLS